MAKQHRIASLALGYAKYQDSWAEQTPQATAKLKTVLHSFDLDLLLPVYNLSSKNEAESELAALGLSSDALEQKCFRQETNIQIPNGQLEQELDAWGTSITSLLATASSLPISVRSRHRISEVHP